MYQILFTEKQYIKNKVLLVLVYISSLIPMVVMSIALVQQILYKESFGNHPVSDSTLIVLWIISILFAIALIYLFRFSYMKIEISTNGFHYRYIPFHRSEKNILPKDVSSYEIVDVKPIRDYGGWGIRYNISGKGKGYIFSGNKGVRFTLRDNKKILFTTEKAESMELALNKVFIKFN